MSIVSGVLAGIIDERLGKDTPLPFRRPRLQMEHQMSADYRTPRRRFLGTLALAGASFALPTSATAQPLPRSTGPDDWDHRWLTQLTRPNMLVFDTKAHGNGDLFGAPVRYLDAMRDGYGIAADQALAVMALSGSAWITVMDDERWERYHLGRFASVTDPANRTVPTRNIFRSHPDPTRATLAVVQARGTIVLVCNNSLRRASRELAALDGSRTADAVYTDLRAGILPGVTVVPAVLAALQLAQARGCSYAMGTA